MKKAIAVLVITLAAFGVAFYASADSGCCLIPQARAAAAQNTKVITVHKVTTLHIEGMTCGACATAVRQVLRKVDGVKDARVSYEQKQGVVTYDPTRVTSEKIARTIEEKLPAYKATVVK
jgi:copper chaperone CopZ